MATASLPPSKLVAKPNVPQMHRVLCHMQGQMGHTQPASYAFRSKRHQIRDFAWLLFLYAKGKKDRSSCGFKHWDETCVLLFVCFHFPSSRWRVLGLTVALALPGRVKAQHGVRPGSRTSTFALCHQLLLRKHKANRHLWEPGLQPGGKYTQIAVSEVILFRFSAL